MGDEIQQRVAAFRAIRDDLRALHERGTQAHRRFLDAFAREDQAAMRQAAREHSAINAHVGLLIARRRVLWDEPSG